MGCQTCLKILFSSKPNEELIKLLSSISILYNFFIFCITSPALQKTPFFLFTIADNLRPWQTCCVHKPRQQQRFTYYRLLKGVQALFAGIRELFRFRWPKAQKHQYIEEVKKQRLLFPEFTIITHFPQVEKGFFLN